MRKILLATSAALAALLVVTSVASAITMTQTFDVVVKPLKLSTKTKPFNVNLRVTAETDVSAADKAAGVLQPAPVNKVVVDFPAGAVLNSKYFKSCTQRTLLTSGPRACPAGSKIGASTRDASYRLPFIEGVAGGGEKPTCGCIVSIAGADPAQAIIYADVQIFNGPPQGGNPTVIFYADATESGIATIIAPIGVVTGSSKSGYTLTTNIDPIPTTPGLPPAAIEKLDFTVNAKTKAKKKVTVKVRGKRKKVTKNVTINYIDAPTKCPSGGFPFRARFEYADGDPQEVNTKLACP